MESKAIAGLLTEQGHMERLAEISFELLWIEAQGAAGDATAAARYVDVYQGAMLPAVKAAQAYFGRFGDAYHYIIADYVALGQLYFADVVGGEEAAPAPVDDDPKCVCGVHRSEHQLCGCQDGFQSPASWAAESAEIADIDDQQFERRYGRGY